MGLKTKSNSDGLFKSIMLAHVILFLHLIFFAALGLLVVMLSGMMQYMFWILLGGMSLVGLSGYLFYRRLRREGKNLSDALKSPMFRGRAVEITLLGGMATFKLDKPRLSKFDELEGELPPLQLEDSETSRIREINTLAQLLEKELITQDEFTKAKQRLLNS